MRKILIPSAIVVLLGGAAWFVAPGLFGAGQEAAQPARGASRAPLVNVEKVARQNFVDSIEAIGTSRASESVTITAKTADTVGSINFTDGQQVERGAILVEMTSAEQAADLAAARAQLSEAEKAYQRAADLVARGISARASLDTAVAARDSARGRVQSIEARLADTIIKAPFAGVVGLRNVSVGSYVSPGDVITTLDDIKIIKADFTVPERLLGSLKSGLAIRVEVAAFPGEEFEGVVTSVDTRIDPATRAVTVRAELPNPQMKLKPGMLMSVTLIVSERDVAAVPESAIVSQGDNRFVFLLDAQNVAARVQVKTGLVKPGSVEILEGVKEGDRIVSKGTNKVIPGQPVKVDGEAAPKPVALLGQERRA
jgi:membrane fusion protein (multidrug efflux system)